MCGKNSSINSLVFVKTEIDIKRKLFSLCEEYANNKINAAQKAIDNAQSSANNETRSSAGDKYETGRSMIQLEIEKYSAQLNEGINLKKALNQINYEKTYQNVQLGSLVSTNNGIFFVSISAGKFSIDGIEYMAISFASPIGQALFNKKAKDKIDFRGKHFIIKSVL